jgi:hypothetical protein
MATTKILQGSDAVQSSRLLRTNVPEEPAAYISVLYAEDRGCRLPQKVANVLPDYTASLQQEPQILKVYY